MSFGPLLREHRLRAGLTQENLSRRCGVSAHAISMLEAGRRRPRLSTVTRVARALGLPDSACDQLIAAARAAAGELSPAAPADESAPHSEQPATASVPHHLPAGTRLFTGRLAELDAIVRLPEHAAHGGAVIISAINGMAGIGKTALAVHAAHHLADRFPDGQLFIDLHGHTQGSPPRTPGDALEALLRALGVSAQRIPDDVEERAALYRQRLAGTRTLIVLDNAASEAQVRPLLPAAAGCLVMVTSRRRLKGLDDAYPLSLDVLSPSDALTLLRAVAGPNGHPGEDRILGQIAELCGYLPLALRIAAALLHHRPMWTAKHLADLLQDHTQRVARLADGERDLGVVFGLSYDHLADTRQGLFRDLGLVPGPDVDAYAIAALVDADLATASLMLEDLVDHNLLLQPAAGRYQLHDLLRAHARALSRADSAGHRTAALDRLLDYYQHVANRADAIMTPYPRPAPEGPVPAHQPRLADHEAALAWLRRERANLLAALEHVAAGDHPDRRTVLLTHGLATLVVTDGPWTDAIALHAAAATAAQRLGDRSGLAYALFHQADLRMLACDYSAAVDAVREALDLCQALDDQRGQANALTYLGYIRTMTGDHPGAAADLTEALRAYRGIGDQLGQANALIRLARVQISIGDHTAALANLEEGLLLCEDLDDRRGQAYALCNIAEIKLSTRDYPGVAEDLHQAVRLFGDLGDHNGRGIAHGYLGQLATQMGDYSTAIRHLEAAIEVYRQTGARGNEAWALNHYAASIAASGDHHRALSLYESALRLSQEVQHPDDEAHALEGIGEHHLHTGDVENGITYLNLALDIYQRLTMTSDADRVLARVRLVSRGGICRPTPSAANAVE
jgi:tetratricopeptide (TPR) repeat protein/transcriptional regulator with XRE-family HTH domain